jgi:hypothetical protein
MNNNFFVIKHIQSKSNPVKIIFQKKIKQKSPLAKISLISIETGEFFFQKLIYKIKIPLLEMVVILHIQLKFHSYQSNPVKKNFKKKLYPVTKKFQKIFQSIINKLQIFFILHIHSKYQ